MLTNILEHARIAYSMTGGLIGALGCGLGCGREVCEDMRKRMIDVCCLKEVRWRGQGARMLGMK